MKNIFWRTIKSLVVFGVAAFSVCYVFPDNFWASAGLALFVGMAIDLMDGTLKL